jgi:cytochrome c
MMWSLSLSQQLGVKWAVTGGAARLGLCVILGWQLPVCAQTASSAVHSQPSIQAESTVPAKPSIQAESVAQSKPSTQAELDKGLSLAKSRQCLGCHQIDTKRVGPAFAQVALRHGDSAGSLEYIAGAIRQGGRGRWGAIPMPAQPQVSESESQLLAQWILSLKP